MKFWPHTYSRTWRGRSGSALIMVVVLVVLLALMGIAFLFAMRAARVQAVAAGNPKLLQGEWPVVDPGGLATATANVLNDVQTKIQAGVKNGGVYLDPTLPESRSTSPQDSLYLSDRMPVADFDTSNAAADIPYLRWHFVTGVSGDPTRHVTAAAGFPANQDIYIAQFPYQYPAAGSWPVMADGTSPYPTWVQEALSGRTRIFPAFVEQANKAAADPANLLLQTNKFMSADADGDGIPDSLLKDTGLTGSLVGIPGVVHFWRAVRVIDNNAALNINTAWRSTADRDFNGNDIAPTNPLYGYLGTFRPNIGLRELLSGGQTDNTAIMTPAEAEADMGLLEQYRFAANYPSLQTVYTGPDNPVTGPGTVLGGYQRLTAAEAMEMGLARRVSTSMQPGFYTAQKRFGIFKTNEQDQLAYHFFMADPAFGATTLAGVLKYGLLAYAPNTRNGVAIPQSLYFGANQQDFWNYTDLNTDNTAGAGRDQFFNTYNSSNYPVPPNTRFTLANVRKTVRPDLVAVNGVTLSTPTIAAPTLAAPTMTQANWDVASPAASQMADFADTPPKVWVNGATFGELWRAYYNVFASTTPVPVQVSRLPAAGLPAGSTGAWDANRQLLLRSAIAAVNTIQAREGPGATTEVRTVTIDGLNVNVYGAKPQPFITEVAVHTDVVDTTQAYDVNTNPFEMKWVAIEIHNPYNAPLNVANRTLYLVNGTTWTNVGSLSGSIAAGGFTTLVATRNTDPAHVPSVTGTTGAFSNPNYVLTNIIGASIRLVASDGAIAGAGGFDAIPQDEVNVTGVQLDDGSHTPRWWRFARPTVDSTTASRFLCVYNDPANVFTDNPDATTLTLGADNPGTGHIIQIGSYSAYQPVANAFPFNGFARDGDILHAAFIGNYSYGTSAATSYTCCVGRDAYWSADPAVPATIYEPVGHFVPLDSANFTTGGASGTSYDWAGRLFDFVTAIQHPGSEHNPDIIGQEALSNTSDHCIQGRININTASWQALAALPLIPVNPNVTGAYDISNADNATKQRDILAQAIVADRLANGPFRSIFDLNRVPGFAWKAAGCGSQNDLLTKAIDIAPLTGASIGCGDISPLDGAIGDSEKRTLAITRISNLITTRSDSFNVYILIQAWLDGTNVAYPVMVGEQRSMYLIDRTPITKGGGSLYVKPLAEQ